MLESLSASCAVQSGRSSGIDSACARTAVIFMTSERKPRLEARLPGNAAQVRDRIVRKQQPFLAVPHVVVRFDLSRIEHFVEAFGERYRFDFGDVALHALAERPERLESS